MSILSKNFYIGKTVLITGGTGSFGQAFAKKLLEEHSPKKIVIFSRDEWKQFEMQHSNPIFQRKEMRFFLGDVRDKERLMRAFSEIDIVIHAAALKQVPAAEYNPTEFIKTNILGSENVINAAIERGVQKVIALSTDKAVNPTNLYGATKLCSDKLFVASRAYIGRKGVPELAVVRYGNVIGSRGSIIPTWQKMIKEGAQELPLTDERMTRFWITMDQAVDFVISSTERARGGEIFVPKIPSMSLKSLKEALAPDLPQKIIGIRPGEKLHELMINQEDARRTVEFDDFYTIYPEGEPLPNEGKRLPEGFSYTSDKNTKWLEIDELKKLLR
jgi:UDP-N-acetylglucosamine 4,6-dehydratase